MTNMFIVQNCRHEKQKRKLLNIIHYKNTNLQLASNKIRLKNRINDISLFVKKPKIYNEESIFIPKIIQKIEMNKKISGAKIKKYK